MALADEVTNRYSAQYIIQVTNPQSAGSSVADTDRLALAVLDAQADFNIYGAGDYDDTDAAHIRIGVERVIAYLLFRNGHASSEALTRLDKTRLDLLSLRQVGHADKITPTTARTAANGQLVNRFPRRSIKDVKLSTPHSTLSDNSDP